MNKNVVAIVLIVVAVIAVIVRLMGGGTDRTGLDTELASILVCEGCGTLSEVGPDFIAENYTAGTVRMVGVETRFACPSCSKKDGRLDSMEFVSTHVKCTECGEVICKDAKQAMKLYQNGGMQMGEDKQIDYMCKKCGEFHGEMMPR